MICFIDEYDAQQLISKLVDLDYDFDSWNHIVRETIISTIDHMGEIATIAESKKITALLDDMEDDADQEVYSILKEYGFEEEY